VRAGQSDGKEKGESSSSNSGEGSHS
jgi:hypothetical protein